MREFPVSETKYLRGLALLILKEVLPENYTVSDTPLYLVRELIMQNVLFSLVEMICDPLFVMEAIKDVLSDENNESLVTGDTQDPSDESLHRDFVTDGNSDNPKTTTSPTLSSSYSSSNSSENTHTQSLQTVIQQTCEDTRSSDSQMPESSGTQSQPVITVEIPGPSINREDIPLPLLSTELHFAPEWNEAYIETR